MTGEDNWRQSGKANFERRVDWFRANARMSLTENQVDFLREAQHQSFRKHGTPSIRPKPMTNAQRSAKGDLIAGWRSGLENLRALDIASPDSNPWFKLKDAKKALPLDALVDVVTFCARNFGTEYADALVRALGPAYAHRGEEIQIVRSLETFRPGHQSGVR